MPSNIDKRLSFAPTQNKSSVIFFVLCMLNLFLNSITCKLNTQIIKHYVHLKLPLDPPLAECFLDLLYLRYYTEAAMRIVLKNFRIIDEEIDTLGGVAIEFGKIVSVSPSPNVIDEKNAALVIDGNNFATKTQLVLMPAFVDLHAHFREPGFPDKENMESASLSAAAGGFTTAICMANTKPVIDTLEKAAAIKSRCDALGIVDLYPVLSLTKDMEGKELSGITNLPCKSGDENKPTLFFPLMLSEDGKDLADDNLLLAAMHEAKRIGIPISCHCDLGGQEAETSKTAGQPRTVWSRIEENNATRRVIELGKKAGCHIHIAHVSTKEAVETIRRAKEELYGPEVCGTEFRGAGNFIGGFTLTCEVMPHNLCLTNDDAEKLGGETWGRVNPPLRDDEDRVALIRAVTDGTIDAIATDHAPHSNADKDAGAAGFSAFETAFAAAFSELIFNRRDKAAETPAIDLKHLSFLMSEKKKKIAGLNDRGRLLPGMRADIVIVDTEKSWVVDPAALKTKGRNTPFAGKEIHGKILMTIRGGRVVLTSQ
jgi:dihydroorotase